MTMETHELIKLLRGLLPEPVDYAELVGAPYWAYGIKYVYEDPEHIIIEEAALKLEQLQQMIDDMMGDHYIDYLEFYVNRCRELEEELERCKNGNNQSKE